MVFRTLTAGAFLVGASTGSTGTTAAGGAEPDAEPARTPSPSARNGTDREREPDAVAGERRTGS